MEKKEQTGIFEKLFGGSKKDSCCTTEIEEIPVTPSESEEETDEKQSEKCQPNTKGCGCCG